MPIYTTENIAYQEYYAINEILHAHRDVYGGRLRAFIVFGELVATGESVHIQLLEVIEGWDGPHHVSFNSTEAVPLRGQLHLYLLTTGEFEYPGRNLVPNESWSSVDLLSQVRKSYAVLMESPDDYAFNVMSRWEDAPTAAPSKQSKEDPISFARRQDIARV